jgi:diphthamide biosynthesis protein 7
MDEEDTTQDLPSLTTIFLDQPPSCLEFCPADPDYFVVGTYLLSEEKKQDDENDGEVVVSQKKTGSLQLWELDVRSSTL